MMLDSLLIPREHVESALLAVETVLPLWRGWVAEYRAEADALEPGDENYDVSQADVADMEHNLKELVAAYRFYRSTLGYDGDGVL